MSKVTILASTLLLFVATAAQGGVPTSTPTPTPTAASLCEPLPRSGCSTAPRSRILIKNRSESGRRIKWVWAGGTISPLDVGDPLVDTDFALCFYDEDGVQTHQPTRLEVSAASGNCAFSCWRALADTVNRGYVYRDIERFQDGVFKVLIKSGKPGADKIIVVSKGSTVPVPVAVSPTAMMHQNSNMTVQLVNSEGFCWEAVYTPAGAKKNDPIIYRGSL